MHKFFHRKVFFFGFTLVFWATHGMNPPAVPEEKKPDSFATPDAYADWINARLARRLRQLREAARLSPYRLGRLCGVSDQAILNLERGQGKLGSMTGTLARLAFHFRLSLTDLVRSAEQGGD